MEGPERSDDELARLIGGGDEAALADLHRRYFPRLYDYALRVARDRDIAALVVQSSLLRALAAPGAGEPQEAFRLQLFAGAHYDLADRLRGRRASGAEPEDAFAVGDPTLAGSPSLAAELPELARLAWQACRELRLDEYELLDLHVRQRLESAEIAAIVRTRPEGIERRLAASSAALEASFAGLLLLARGRQTCLDLDFLVGEDAWSTTVRRRVARHFQSCLTCQQTRQRHPGALAVVAGLALAPAPEGWEETILTRLQETLRGGAAAPAPVPVGPVAMPSAAPKPRVEPRAASAAAGGGFGDVAGGILAGAGERGPLLAVLGGAILVIAIVFGALCGAGAFDSGGSSGGATPTVSPTLASSATPTESPTLTPTKTQTSAPLEPTETPSPPPPTSVPPTATEPAPTRRPPSATPRPPTATPVIETPPEGPTP